MPGSALTSCPGLTAGSALSAVRAGDQSRSQSEGRWNPRGPGMGEHLGWPPVRTPPASYSACCTMHLSAGPLKRRSSCQKRNLPAPRARRGAAAGASCARGGGGAWVVWAGPRLPHGGGGQDAAGGPMRMTAARYERRMHGRDIPARAGAPLPRWRRRCRRPLLAGPPPTAGAVKAPAAPRSWCFYARSPRLPALDGAGRAWGRGRQGMAAKQR